MRESAHGPAGISARFVCALLMFLACGVRAERSPVAFESRYLGDGWFEYSASTTDDPFFLFLDLPGVLVHFGDVIEAGPLPARWTNTFTTSLNSWNFEGIGLGDQIRPYRATFRLRSSHTTFKRMPAGGVVVMSLAIAGGYHGYLASANIAGYWIPDALVPCPPEEADGSVTNLLVWCPMINGLPEPRLTGVVRDGDEQVGVEFEYPGPSTVRLEGSRDFRAWTNIAYIHGQSGAATWTTNVSLAAYGNFFRLRLVAEGHATNLPPLNSPKLAVLAQSKSAGTSAAPAMNCALTPDDVQLTIGSTPGKTYAISVLDPNLRPAESVQVKASGATTTVRFPAREGQVGFYHLSEVR
jgi:hypothetical protein